MTEPSLFMTMNISPGVPSSYRPTVIYPFVAAYRELVRNGRGSSGKRRRRGDARPAEPWVFTIV